MLGLTLTAVAVKGLPNSRLTSTTQLHWPDLPGGRNGSVPCSTSLSACLTSCWNPVSGSLSTRLCVAGRSLRVALVLRSPCISGLNAGSGTKMVAGRETVLTDFLPVLGHSAYDTSLNPHHCPSRELSSSPQKHAESEI